MNSPKSSTQAAAILLLTLCAAPTLFAQDGRHLPSSSTAEQVEEQAIQLQLKIAEGGSADFRGDLKRLAKLHQRAAALRSPTDPARYENLTHAARITYEFDPARAERLYASAAAGAHSLGDARVAVQAYAMAAWIIDRRAAVTPADIARGDGYRAHVRLLRNSPALTNPERVALDQLLISN
jgi:hypothetical protein